MRREAAFTSVFFLCVLLASISCPAFSEEKEILSIWSASPLKINGSDEEWGEAAICFEKKFKVDYAFQNDENNLYVLFKFNDLSYLSSIDDAGMTIWFSIEKKKKKDYGITFIKKKVPTETFLSFLGQQRAALPEEDKERLRKKPFHFIYLTRIIDKKASSPEVVENRESPSPLFVSASAKEKVIYEFIIPLKSERGFAAAKGIKSGQVIKVGFEWGGLTEEMKKERIKKIQEMAEKQGSPDARIEDDLRRDRVLDTDFNKSGSDPKKYAFWVDVRLAKKE